jgi:hypothetical protein
LRKRVNKKGKFEPLRGVTKKSREGVSQSASRINVRVSLNLIYDWSRGPKTNQKKVVSQPKNTTAKKAKKRLIIDGTLGLKVKSLVFSKRHALPLCLFYNLFYGIPEEPKGD